MSTYKTMQSYTSFRCFFHDVSSVLDSSTPPEHGLGPGCYQILCSAGGRAERRMHFVTPHVGTSASTWVGARMAPGHVIYPTPPTPPIALCFMPTSFRTVGPTRHQCINDGLYAVFMLEIGDPSLFRRRSCRPICSFLLPSGAVAYLLVKTPGVLRFLSIVGSLIGSSMSALITCPNSLFC